MGKLFFSIELKEKFVYSEERAYLCVAKKQKEFLIPYRSIQ